MNPTATAKSFLMMVIARNMMLIMATIGSSNMMMEGGKKLNLNEDGKEFQQDNGSCYNKFATMTIVATTVLMIKVGRRLAARSPTP